MCSFWACCQSHRFIELALSNGWAHDFERNLLNLLLVIGEKKEFHVTLIVSILVGVFATKKAYHRWKAYQELVTIQIQYKITAILCRQHTEACLQHFQLNQFLLRRVAFT